MYETDVRPSTVTAPTRARGRHRVALPASHPRAHTSVLAGEDPAGYDTTGAWAAPGAEGAVPGGEGAVPGGEGAVPGGEGAAPGEGVGGAVGAVGSAPRAVEARARLARCQTTPGSPLGQAVGALAAAVDALTHTVTRGPGDPADPADPTDAGALGDPGGLAHAGGLAGAGGGLAGDGDGGGLGEGLVGEHVDVVGDALVAVAHLRTRLDACQLGLLRAFDRRGGHHADGAVTAASWLAGRTRTDYSATARLAATAQRLDLVPRLGAHLAAGDVTMAHVTAVTDRAVPARAEVFAVAGDLLADLAVTNPPRDVRHAVRHLVELNHPDGPEATDPDAPGGDPLRELRLGTGFQSRGNLLATLDPLTREALTVLLDAFSTPDAPDTPLEQRRTPAQRRHDAFAAMLHTLLAQPDLPTVQGARPQILIAIDLATLLGLPPDHPAAHLTLADLAALLDIDLPGLTDPDADGDTTDATGTQGTDPDADGDTTDATGTQGTDADGADGAGDTTDATGTQGTDADGADGAGDTTGERDPSGGATGTTTPGPPCAPDRAGTDPHATATTGHPTGPEATGSEATGPDPEATGPDPEATGPDPTGSDATGPAPPAPPRPPPPRRPRFGSGAPVSPAAVRGLLPAATIMAVLTLGPWRAVNVGNKHRTLPAWLRTVLAAIHVHCRGPDCDRRPAWTQAHHITPWVTARTTDLNDTLPLCPAQHKLIDQGWTATLDLTTGNVTWTSPTGRTIIMPPPNPYPWG